MVETYFHNTVITWLHYNTVIISTESIIIRLEKEANWQGFTAEKQRTVRWYWAGDVDRNRVFKRGNFRILPEIFNYSFFNNIYHLEIW